ncbi:hypothetical protein LJY25_02185 [Hymenobacter sp. BT175]|uniref:DUF7033 domain-containing protein n=1 Tax=Hymenobacter translucens TaxID=2886507 RepID=UPI001D0EC449|nr:hypothetical protein [Hymenobacter translucens]MCC2545239.1 hypothetical protein [Hymenobacter translucens]
MTTSSAPELPSSLPQVTAQVRLDYVLHHFRQAYPAAPRELLGYAGLNPSAPVQVADGAGWFFTRTSPYPPEPVWHEWHGHRLPFFFQPAPATALLSLEDGRVTIYSDLIADAFYLLSGWQEYFSADRDQHGRFPFEASVQHRYSFVTVPAVNYYFDILKTALEHVSGRQLKSATWSGHSFAAFITHDIDNLRSAWKAEGRQALRVGHLGTFLRLAAQRWLARDAWDNLEDVLADTARYDARSIFFFLGNPRPAANGTANADYDLTTPAFQRRIQTLAEAGAEVGVHGSLGTATDITRLQKELQQLPVPATGNRFHYLSWEPRTTPFVVAEAGLTYDSSLGFAEHYGFRNSYCLPFCPFDFRSGRMHDFVEIPLNVMDATLHHPRYLQLAPDEVLTSLQPMLAEIERFGGVCTVLWHNENFSPRNHHTGPRQFHELMSYLRGRNAAFVTGPEICEEMADRAADVPQSEASTHP